MSDGHYILYGALGSPYSMKMRALMRYRRIPFVWAQGARAMQIAGALKAPVIPVLEYPDGRRANDSTPLIYDLEARIHNGRGVIPVDPAQAFLGFLIEDFADEWLTKAMFSYRWLRPRDQAQMSAWLAFDSFAGGGRTQIDGFAQMFRDRQVGRMALVGCTPENAPLIESATRTFLAALDAHVSDRLFLFGSRPSLAEFAIYGQLSQLGTDPTAQEMMRADYPYAYRWLAHMEDLSGVEGEWDAPETPASLLLVETLKLIGEVYFPFLKANAEAIAAGAAEMAFEALGHRYVQAPFKYQVKCLAELRKAFAGLADDHRNRLKPLLEQTKCLAPLEAQS